MSINMLNFAYCSDKYQYTMGKSFYDNGMKDKRAIFNFFYRLAPENNNWAVVCGTDEVIEMIQNLGKADPDFYGGIQNNFNIGRFKIGIFFNYSVGGVLYNYAELYPVATYTTDAEGKVSMLTGCGDIMVWAVKGRKFGLGKASGEHNVVQLSHELGECFAADFDIVPPSENPLPNLATEEQIAAISKLVEIIPDVVNKLTADKKIAPEAVETAKQVIASEEKEQ